MFEHLIKKERSACEDRQRPMRRRSRSRRSRRSGRRQRKGQMHMEHFQGGLRRMAAHFPASG